MSRTDAFDLETTFVHLDHSGADTVANDENFWPDPMAGRTDYPGRLAMVLPMTEDFAHWERHPAGEELIVMLAGAMDVILDEAAGERTVRLQTGQAMLVPKGIWHRGVIRMPGKALFVTEGEGTDHRPIADPA